MPGSESSTRELRELAIFSDAPAPAPRLHVGRPAAVDVEAFITRVRDILETRWFTNDGPYVQQLEAILAEVTGARHCIAVANGTLGLELVIRALGLRGEVIVPSFTFVATAHALSWHGIRPVFCDVDPVTHNIDPDRIEALITDQTSAILGVHLWGRPCDVAALAAVARRHGIQLLFDAAHAFGASHDGVRIGNFGAAEVFSFHATKFITTFEGGAIATNDDVLAERLRLLRNFGFVDYDTTAAAGINAKLSEIAAAMGITSLEGRDNVVQASLLRHARYCELLEASPALRVLRYDPSADPSYQYVIVEVDEEMAGLGRDELLRVLHAEGILARRYFYPGCHRMEPYARLDTAAAGRLPVTDRLTGRVLALPTGPSVEMRDVDRVCDVILCSIQNATMVRMRLALGRAAPPTWINQLPGER